MVGTHQHCRCEYQDSDSLYRAAQTYLMRFPELRGNRSTGGAQDAGTDRPYSGAGTQDSQGVAGRHGGQLVTGRPALFLRYGLFILSRHLPAASVDRRFDAYRSRLPGHSVCVVTVAGLRRSANCRRRAARLSAASRPSQRQRLLGLASRLSYTRRDGRLWADVPEGVVRVFPRCPPPITDVRKDVPGRGGFESQGQLPKEM